MTNSTSTLAPEARRPATNDGNQVARERKAAASRLYQVVWRWHFYAGLFVAPIFLMVTLTGAIYVFRTELTAIRDRSLQVVTPTAQRKTYEELHQIAIAAAAPRAVESIIVHPEADRSVRFVAHLESEAGDHGGGHLEIYLNPYTGAVLGSRVAEDDFFAIVLQLHRNLMLGSTGRVVTELSTSWGLLLLATGVYLWWPRGKKNASVFLPRLRGKLYSTLRDLHAVTGFYIVPLASLLIGTGLFFSIVWGTGFITTVRKSGHWPDEWFATPRSLPPTKDAQPASLDRVVAAFLRHSRPHDNVGIALAEKPDIAHKAWMIQDEDKNSYRAVAVDQYTAETLQRMDAQATPPLYRVRLLTVSIHMGQIFGVTTKILALLTSLVLLGLTITGVWMWWQRRPAKRTGFPRRPEPRSLPAWGWAIVVGCGLLLPSAGISMLVIGLADWGWRSFARRSTTDAA